MDGRNDNLGCNDCNECNDYTTRAPAPIFRFEAIVDLSKPPSPKNPLNLAVGARACSAPQQPHACAAQPPRHRPDPSCLPPLDMRLFPVLEVRTRVRVGLLGLLTATSTSSSLHQLPCIKVSRYRRPPGMARPRCLSKHASRHRLPPTLFPFAPVHLISKAAAALLQLANCRPANTCSCPQLSGSSHQSI